MKETRKQIVAQVTNKLASKFNLEREYQNKRYSELWVKYEAEVKKHQELHEENLMLKDKVEKYEDWIHRLQEFCNLPDGERERAIEAFKAEQAAKHKYAEFVGGLDFFQRAIGIMF